MAKKTDDSTAASTYTTTGTSSVRGGTRTASSTRTKKDDSSAKAKRTATDKFLADMRSKFHAIADSPNESLKREMALDDLKFYVGSLGRDPYESGQWPSNISARLRARRKPCLTLNRIKPAVKQVTNSMRLNRPSPWVYPVDDKADKRTARVLQGMFRHIESNSMADIAYDTACNGQTTGGVGYFRWVTEFTTPKSFTQEIKIQELDDPFAVYMGPHKPDCSDLNDAFIVTDYDGDSYAAKFTGKSEFAGLNDFTAIGNMAKGWGRKNNVRVVEYYYRTFEDVPIVQLQDGQVMDVADINDELMELLRSTEQIVDERTSEVPTVHWCVSNGVEKLDEEIIPGEDIPIFEVVGDRQIVDGVEYQSGIVRDAKDAQRQYNYFRSKMSEVISLAPTSPWIMAEGQDEGHEREWDLANIENYAVLRYKPKSLSSHLAPPPQRNMAEPPIQAMVLASAQYEEDIKATTQVYDSKLGSRSNEVSGKAQQMRAQQSDTGNYNLHDNFGRTIRRLGRSLVKVIPIVYDARTVARIIGEDDKEEKVNIINDPSKPAYEAVETEDGGIKEIYNLGTGIYDVAIGIGPNFLTKRQEAFEMLTKLVNSFPGLMEVGGDVILGNSDIPGAEELRTRLKRFIELKNPDLLNDGEDQPPIPPKFKAAMDQAMKMVEALTGQVEEYKKIIETKQIESGAKLEQITAQGQAAKEIEAIKLASSDFLGQLKISSDEHIAAMKAEVEQAKIIAKANADLLGQKLSMLDTIIAGIMKPGPVEGGVTTT